MQMHICTRIMMPNLSAAQQAMEMLEDLYQDHPTAALRTKLAYDGWLGAVAVHSRPSLELEVMETNPSGDGMVLVLALTSIGVVCVLVAMCVGSLWWVKSSRRQAKLREIGIELREDDNATDKASGGGDDIGGGAGEDHLKALPATAATTEYKHPSRKERAKKANNAARRKASILGSSEVHGARAKVQPVDGYSLGSSAAALPDGQSKEDLSLRDVFEEIVSDEVSLVHAHAHSTAMQQADELSGQVGKSIKSAKL